MQQKRRRGVVRTESYVHPEVIEARHMKEVTGDFYPYEYVFYTSKPKTLYGHPAGTNEYIFEFPGSWRTKSGGDLILAIRGIHLKKTTRAFGLKMILKFFDSKNPNGLAMFDYSPISTISDMISTLNDQFRNQIHDLEPTDDAKTSDKYKIWNNLKKNHVQWRLYVTERGNRIELLDENRGLGTLDLTFEIHPDSDMKGIFDIEYLHVGHVFPNNQWGNNGAPAIHMWNRQDLLLTADFITQADNQHLGYTGSEYAIFKEYEIKKNTPYFTIKPFEDETLREIELPKDNKDYVVIEAVISRKYEI